jgi:hypothetical protein
LFLFSFFKKLKLEKYINKKTDNIKKNIVSINKFQKKLEKYVFSKNFQEKILIQLFSL